MLTFCCIQMHIPSLREVLAFIFIFQKVVFYYPLPKNGIINRPKLCFKFQNSLKVIWYTLLNVLILKLNIYCCQDKFYERSKFGQYDEVKNDAPLKTIDFLMKYWKLTHSYTLRSFLFSSGFAPFPPIIQLMREPSL